MRTVKLFGGICMSLVPMFSLPSAAADSKSAPVNITTIADIWCPYTCESNDNDPGFFVELVSAALKGSAYKSNYTVAVRERSLSEAKAGHAEIVLSAAESDAGDDLDISFFSLKSPTCGFVKESSKKTITTPADLDKFSSIGTIKGYSYGPKFQEFLDRKDLPPGKVQALSQEESVGSNLKKVVMDRQEVALEDPAVVTYWSRKIQITGLKDIGCSPDVVPVYVGLSKKSKHYKKLATAMRDGIKAAEKSGEVARLIKKYGVRK